MRRDHLYNETLTLIKPNDETFDGIQARVSSDQIITANADAPVEERDILLRALPNGLSERYIVLDKGFFSGSVRVRAHYQIKVRKETAIDTNSAAQVTYNLHGPNSRVNNQSVDLSTNTATIGLENVFVELKRAIELHVPHGDGQDMLLNEVTAMEDARGTDGYLLRYQKFIEAAANHMTLVAPFIPALTHLLKLGS